MTRLGLALIAVVAALLGLTGLAGCGRDPSATVEAAASITSADAVLSAVEKGALLLDVRTPEEFAEGHLADALNLDVQGDRFEAKAGRLDKGAAYVVYCRTGARAAEAVQRMGDLGFTDVVNGGALADLLKAGLPEA